MCGIAGFINRDNAGHALQRVPSALNLLEHRGPDDAGYLAYSSRGITAGNRWTGDLTCEPEAILLHRRLSILDLSQTGHQPMSSADGRYHLTYNGEIYNYLELREELARLGHVFRSRSDSEVLLAAYAQWGSDALTRLTGMFAFAILDTVSRKLFLARDFFGIKPLYYARTAAGFFFASELKALLELASVNRSANPERLYLYLRFGMTDHGAGTLFSELQQLPPAHYLEISLDRPEAAVPVRYWTPGTDRDADLSLDEAASHLRNLFLKNVSLHLRSDVPVGAALSGGIDSSAIVAAMRYLEPSLEIHAFSYISDDPSLSEEKWVDIAASAARAGVHKVRPEPQELVDDLDILTYCQDEPFGSTSIYAQYRVFREAARMGIKVMLDGQGADEILGGYRPYMAARLASLIRRNRWTEAGRFLGRCSQWPGASKPWLIAKTADYLLPRSLQAPLRKMIGRELMPAWMNEGWFARRGVASQVLDYSSGASVLKHDMLHDLTETSLPYLLRYEDRNSMAFSIESRVPFLTPELVNFMLSLPDRYIVADDGCSKAVFRAAMRGIVPDAILDRRDKIGFATPERNWLGGLHSWMKHVLGSDAAREIPALNFQQLTREFDQAIQGRKRFDFRLWRMVNLIQWTRQFHVRYA